MYPSLTTQLLRLSGSWTSSSLLQRFMVLMLLPLLHAGRFSPRNSPRSAKMIIEYRIPMPLTVEEFHRGQLHMVAEKSLEVGEGAADEGVEWMRNEPYDNTGESSPVLLCNALLLAKSELLALLAVTILQSVHTSLVGCRRALGQVSYHGCHGAPQQGPVHAEALPHQVQTAGCR